MEFLFVDITTRSCIEEVDHNSIFDNLIKKSVFSDTESVRIRQSDENLYIQTILIRFECEDTECFGEAWNQIFSSMFLEKFLDILLENNLVHTTEAFVRN